EKQQGEQTTQYSWDGFNRLRKISNATGETQYFYDVFGRRIGKENAQGKTTFIWDGDVIALEKTAEHTRHYLFEPNSFVPLAQIVEQGESSHTAYYHVDQLGTPQTLSDENGEIAWSAEYKAWGEAQVVISEAAKTAGINNPIRFQGQYFDEESGLHYNRHRYYDPEIGRFISSDPIGLMGGFNTLAYAPNPTGWIDPQGLARDAKSSYPSTDVMPKIAGTERHHIIPYHLRDHPALIEADTNINSAKNMIYLPRHCNDKISSKRTRHSCFKLGDDKHSSYDKHMKSELDRIEAQAANTKGWDADKTASEIAKLQNKTRQELRTGKTKWP
ncbi:MAG: RHS domain-containing protein, partial [Burkholderiales bacterium]|nr:RHS domain-containing protein [Burkholderiales bacterium]